VISGRDVLYIASIDWSFQWQGPQEIAVRLGAAGNRVLYVENTGVRAPRMADARRVARRLGAWTRSRVQGGVREVAPNVHVSSPLVLPPLGPPWQRAANRRLLAAQLGGVMRRLRFEPSLIWTYLPTDTALDLARRFHGPGVALAYYCVADFAELAPRADRLDLYEREMAARSDVVFVSCHELAARLAGAARQVHLFPFGVDLGTFRPEALAGPPPPGGAAPLHGLPRPIIGYVGALERAVDLELMVAMARARPRWSWVYVGAVMRDLGALARLPNVHLLGQRPHRELPHHVAAFDVAIVPYARNRLTRTVVPTKINEYLAMGKAVVATDLPSVIAFEERHRTLVATPPEPAAFLAAIERSLAVAGDPAAIRHRRAVAAEADWGRRLEQMMAVVEEKLAGK
jgi:glycosyltransferase involved in cell wall biosynthesis